MTKTNKSTPAAADRVLALQLLMTWWIRRTKLGMGLIAIREDETKAATIGINLPVEKIIAFVASAVFVGMAGAIYGYYLSFVDPIGMFNILLSVQILLSMLLAPVRMLFHTQFVLSALTCTCRRYECRLHSSQRALLIPLSEEIFCAQLEMTSYLVSLERQSSRLRGGGGWK